MKSCGARHKQEIWKLKDYNLTSQSVKSSTVRWYLQKALVNWGTRQEPSTRFHTDFVFNSCHRPVSLLIKTALLLVAQFNVLKKKNEQIHCRQYFGLEGARGSRFTARESGLVLWSHGIKQKLFNPKRLQVSGNYPNPHHFSSLGRITDPQGCTVDAVRGSQLYFQKDSELTQSIYLFHDAAPSTTSDLRSQIHSRGFTKASKADPSKPTSSRTTPLSSILPV